MSTSGRKRKQLLKPRQDIHRSPLKRQSLDVKIEPQLVSSYPLADYDCEDVKPDLTELQLQNETNIATATTAQIVTVTPTTTGNSEPELEQQSDSDEDGYSEINFEAPDMFVKDEVDEYDPEWTAEQSSPRLIFKFNTPMQQTGLTAPRKSLCPVFCFYQLLGNRAEFFTHLARSCNGRSSTLGASAEELEIFVGLCLLMSDVKLTHLSDYWSENMFCGFVGFSQKMSQARFLELLQALNFDELKSGTASTSNVTGDAGQLINYFNTRMSEIYVCGQQLVLNEPIIQWKNKFNYQHELPEKYRYNAQMLHLLTEPSGLIIRIVPENSVSRVPRNSRELVVHRNELAMQLLQDQQQRGRSLYVCKYYGSFGLAFELAKQGIYCSGLLDRCRYGNSKVLVHQHLASKSFATRYATPMMMAKWRRREKSIYFYSSDCLAIYAKELSMQKTNARPKLIQELEYQLQSTKTLRQQLMAFQPNCLGLQRHQQLAIYVLNMLVFNAHLLYIANSQRARVLPSTDGPKLKSYAECRMAIIKSLLKMNTSNAVSSVPEISFATLIAINNKPIPKRFSDPKPIDVKHEPVIIQQNGKPARKNCRYCGKSGMLQYTKFMCVLCPNNPGLCQDPCFKMWHEELK